MHSYITVKLLCRKNVSTIKTTMDKQQIKHCLLSLQMFTQLPKLINQLIHRENPNISSVVTS